MKCPICGTENQDRSARFCTECGAKIEPSQAGKQPAFPHDISAVWPEWKIEKLLGRGSFGVVYQAVRRDELVQTQAAIKVISVPANQSEATSLMAEGMDASQTKDFFRGIVNDFTSEINIMESFKGAANIVVIDDYKVVEKADGIGWDILMRMELLKPFNEYIRTHTMTESEVIKLGIDICTALEICSSRNVIHRDVKPENIFINKFGTFKLGDFGTARSLENLSGNLSQKGTPNYIAPEIAGSTEYDSKVDIYSLGIVLYRLLNQNRLPFLSAEQQTNPNCRAEALDRRLRGEPLIAPCDASPAMAQIILRACAYHPADRYSFVGDMKKDLERLQSSLRNDSWHTEAATPHSADPADHTMAVRKPSNENTANHPSFSPASGNTNNAYNQSVNTFSAPTAQASPLWIIIICMTAAILLITLILGVTLLRDDSGGKKSSGSAAAETTAETSPSVMPNCVGWSYEEAVSYFSATDCTIECTYVFDDATAPETILAQQTPEGTPLNPPPVLHFTVSKGADVCPYPYSQKVTVVASPRSSSAQLTLYDWENGDWASKFSCAATVGKNGISLNYGEGKGYTPMGTFKLGIALSQGPINNDAWPIQYVTSNTCIVDDTSSRFYNTIQSRSSLSSSVHYDPIGKTLVSGSTAVCLYIEHNGNGLTSDGVVAGKGSAITLCGKRNGYSPHTAGCVDITQSSMETLLSLLNIDKNPHIEITTQ